jgi:hypothetical protein
MPGKVTEETREWFGELLRDEDLVLRLVERGILWLEWNPTEKNYVVWLSEPPARNDSHSPSYDRRARSDARRCWRFGRPVDEIICCLLKAPLSEGWAVVAGKPSLSADVTNVTSVIGLVR